MNNLAKVAKQLCPSENRCHDLMIASPTFYRYATAPLCCYVDLDKNGSLLDNTN